MTAFQFALAYVLELVLGNPRWFSHPVRGLSFSIQWLEIISKRVSATPFWGKGTGLLLAIGFPTVIFLVCHFMIVWIGKYGNWVQSLLIVILAYSTLATRSFHQEAARVVNALKDGRVSEARKRLNRTIGRDVGYLTYPEILKAVLETLAVNLSERVIAPLFYLFLGGVPLAMAFKTVNTLDSMVGYKDSRYLHFGWAAGRLDDLLNYIPARITVLLICLLAWPLGLSAGEAWRIRKRDGGKAECPKAAIPEAALAGAMQIQLGGPVFYDGEKRDKPYLGDDRSEITLADYNKTVMVIYGVSLVMALFVFALRLLWDWKTK
ncbi:MAG: cobalamin biosynthesis protein CobD [Deltaproteobacteria bacterium]|nr:cobalamin biosynthesis protein CobD [Deltaproteobacteria bacterium]